MRDKRQDNRTYEIGRVRDRSEPCPRCGAQPTENCRTTRVNTNQETTQRQLSYRRGTGRRETVRLGEPGQPGIRAYRRHKIMAKDSAPQAT